MTLKASDLTSNMRQNILDKIKDTVGHDQYHQMVDVMGEDRILDMVLEKAGGESDSTWTWSQVAGACLIVAWLIFGVISGYRDGGIGGALGNVFIVILSVAPGLIWLLTKWLAKITGVLAAVGIGIAVAGAVLFGLYKAVIYAGAGTAGWFQWLIGHF